MSADHDAEADTDAHDASACPDCLTVQWDQAIRETATKLRAASGAAGALVMLVGLPWVPDDEDSASSGIAGSERLNPLRMASMLREMARTLEEQATKIGSREPFLVEKERRPEGKPS